MGRYADVAELKAHLRINDDTDDDSLSIALDGAEGAIDSWCRRTFDEVDPDADQSEQRQFDAVWATELDVDDLVDVDSIDVRTSPIGSWQSVDTATLELLPLNASAKGHPYTSLRLGRTLFGVVRVTGWFGWPSIPDVVKNATILQAARLHARRSATMGVSTVVSTEGTGMRLLAKLDPDVEQLLTGVRRDPVLI